MARARVTSPIVILIPTRQRIDHLRRAVNSLLALAHHPVVVFVGFDDDVVGYQHYTPPQGVYTKVFAA